MRYLASAVWRIGNDEEMPGWLKSRSITIDEINRANLVNNGERVNDCRILQRSVGETF